MAALGNRNDILDVNHAADDQGPPKLVVMAVARSATDPKATVRSGAVELVALELRAWIPQLAGLGLAARRA